jgi:hypothetical protein
LNLNPAFENGIRLFMRKKLLHKAMVKRRPLRELSEGRLQAQHIVASRHSQGITEDDLANILLTMNYSNRQATLIIEFLRKDGVFTVKEGRLFGGNELPQISHELKSEAEAAMSKYFNGRIS